ncbi:MAG: penicillin-binding protein 1A [Alphaproteobacteria bacterium]
MKILSSFFSFMFVAIIVGTIFALYIVGHYSKDLPDYRQLANYEPPITSRFYAGDGSFLSEFAIEKRLFVPFDVFPKRLIEAFLSAEDKNFMTHPGIDITGILRAIVSNVKAIGSHRRMMGGSTITQQVAKNFLLTSAHTFERKIKEAILAFRIERAFSKEHILELYLNEIYLGYGSYGVAAAAINYFNKSLDELTLEECAFLAALPKAPNNYNPATHYDEALARRNWVINRMLDDGKITKEEADAAQTVELKTLPPKDKKFIDNSEYFTEEVRRELQDIYGEKALYEGGLAVRTTLDPFLQETAYNVLQKGLENYDRRRGYRGALADIETGDNWLDNLKTADSPVGIKPSWEKAVVIKLNNNDVEIGLESGEKGTISLDELKWARRIHKDDTVDPPITKPSEVLKTGNVVLVEKLKDNAYGLRQIPEVNGAIVAMDPHTGRVLAMVGGYSYKRSQFNRVIQAKRQPGSSFKPFIYLAALDSGYTPADLILDAPYVVEQGEGMPVWKPVNYGSVFYGPTTLRMGVEKSRNLMTVRLAEAIGMPKVSEYAKKFGIYDNLPPLMSMSLGAGETSLMRLASAYAILVNGGKRVIPTLVDRVQDRKGRTIFRHDARICDACSSDEWNGDVPPPLPDDREEVVNPLSAYQMVSILQGVVERGTGISISYLHKPLAGKTGTTNDNYDAWFMGFSPDLVAGVFVGYDNPKSLGKKETGSRVAAPIFKDFMKKALENVPNIPFRIPSGIKLVRINYLTGKPAKTGDEKVIWEAFKPDTIIGEDRKIIGGNTAINETEGDFSFSGQY